MLPSGLPRLPELVQQKLTKTGYTRGATQMEIYQNRVARNNTVLIDWDYWEQCKAPADGSGGYQNGYIVLVRPSWYFERRDADEILASEGLALGRNALLLFRHRHEWTQYRPTSGRLPNGLPFAPATSRNAPLGGTYMARIHAIVSEDGDRVDEGFTTTRMRGAGIRVYEYASSETIGITRLQLEALIWHAYDVGERFRAAGMSADAIDVRRTAVITAAENAGLLDLPRLRKLRMLDERNELVCPLCLLRISAGEFLKRVEQAQGRETYDLTNTEISLFHIEELRIGKLQHKPYNLGWGHHFCNVVVRDEGIARTLKWMRSVLGNQAHVDTTEGGVPDSVE